MSQKPLLHRDSLHKDSLFDPLAAALLDTAPLQRLGRVLQLGYAHLVFRGGTHTRLSHSMGASHVAGDLVHKLRNNYSAANIGFCPTNAVLPEEFLPCPTPETQKKRPSDNAVYMAARWEFLECVCRWAALLHDIGHIPLGHTLEDEFDRVFPKHDEWSNQRLIDLWLGENAVSQIADVLKRKDLYPQSFEQQLHIKPQEVFDTVLLICCHKENRATAHGGPKTFAETLVGPTPVGNPKLFEELNRAHAAATKPDRRTFSPLMADLVANTICADYLDYVRRDPLYVGLDVLSDDRVASRFYVGRHEKWGQRMALSLLDRKGKSRTDTATGVFELVRQRFRFAETIYYHKTKVAASAMFVKALTLINGSPNRPKLAAHGALNPMLTLQDVSKLGTRLVGKFQEEYAVAEVDSLRSEYTPSNLMSPDLGDDSLHLFLQETAWSNVRAAVVASNEQDVRDNLQAISLLGGISRRKLFKLSASMDGDQIMELSGTTVGERDNKIQTVIDWYRPALERRRTLEDEMCAAAHFPSGAIILYVPERKSQAKGVETFAINGSSLETLGNHPLLKAKMMELNNDYKRLWRFLVFVHPDYCEKWADVSKAIDVLVDNVMRNCFASVRLTSERLNPIKRAIVRGSYFLSSETATVTELKKLCGEDISHEAIADNLSRVKTLVGNAGWSTDSTEEAQLTYVSMKVFDRQYPDRSNHSAKVDQHFLELCKRGALSVEMSKRKDDAVRNFGGISDESDVIKAQLESIATDMLSDRSDRARKG